MSLITFAQDHLDAPNQRRRRINERRVLYPVFLQKFLVLVAERGFLAGSILEVRLEGVVLQASNQPIFFLSNFCRAVQKVAEHFCLFKEKTFRKEKVIETMKFSLKIH